MIEPKTKDLLDGLQPLASELGVDVVLQLVKHFGGVRLYVPVTWRDDLAFNAILGEEMARRLCTLFGPEQIDIPFAPWTSAAIVRFVAELDRQGRSVSEIALTLGVSYKRVQRARSGRPTPPERRRGPDPRQINLIDWLNGSS